MLTIYCDLGFVLLTFTAYNLCLTTNELCSELYVIGKLLIKLMQLANYIQIFAQPKNYIVYRLLIVCKVAETYSLCLKPMITDKLYDKLPMILQTMLSTGCYLQALSQILTECLKIATKNC